MRSGILQSDLNVCLLAYFPPVSGTFFCVCMTVMSSGYREAVEFATMPLRERAPTLFKWVLGRSKSLNATKITARQCSENANFNAPRFANADAALRIEDVGLMRSVHPEIPREHSSNAAALRVFEDGLGEALTCLGLGIWGGNWVVALTRRVIPGFASLVASH